MNCLGKAIGICYFIDVANPNNNFYKDIKMATKTKWVPAQLASKILDRNINNLYVSFYFDKKAGWNRRFKKDSNDRLWVNIGDFRLPHESNSLTKKKIADLYFELEDEFGSSHAVARVVTKRYPDFKTPAVNMYFINFVFAKRKMALSMYLILRQIKKECINTALEA